MLEGRLEEGSRLVGATSWGSIATGVFVGLAIQTVLLLFGMAIARSAGDHIPGGGFAVWAVISELIGVAIGAGLAASLSHVDRRASGMAAGVLTWSVTLVLGMVASGFAMAGRLEGGVWAPFLGAVLSLAAAIVGGWIGAGAGGAARGSGTVLRQEPSEMTAHPVH